jgi:uncharacterized protein (TIGR02646 family)
VAPPAILSEGGAAGPLERQKAEGFYRVESNLAKALPGGFKVYKHDAVKTALNDLFHGKCAYCESRYSTVHPVDIEHYRPKAAVIHASVLRKPGYYWLAADWANLLPSCIDCNRARKHPTVDTEAEPELSGKANWFPISNENDRAESPGQEQRERRLLLDPCRDHPEAHFTYAPDGLVESPTSKGKKSVEVYGLNRPELVVVRRELRERVMSQMRQVNANLRNAKRNQTEQGKTALANSLQNLFAFATEDQPYLGLVVPVIDRYVAKIAKKLRADFAADVTPNQPDRPTVDAFVNRFENQTADPFGELEDI